MPEKAIAQTESEDSSALAFILLIVIGLIPLVFLCIGWDLSHPEYMISPGRGGGVWGAAFEAPKFARQIEDAALKTIFGSEIFFVLLGAMAAISVVRKWAVTTAIFIILVFLLLVGDMVYLHSLSEQALKQSSRSSIATTHLAFVPKDPAIGRVFSLFRCYI